jgi:glycosyltransferase involved in cell wall biosynthesis
MILLISSVFPPEPVVSAEVGNDLAVALSENSDVKVITPKPTRPMGFSFNKEIIETRKFEQIVLNSFTCPESRLIGRMRESFSFGKHAASYIKKNRTEIKCIYVHAWPLLAQFLIAKTSKKYSIPYVLHIVDIYPEALLLRLPFLKRFFFRLLLPIDKYVQKNSSRVVTISDGMKDFLRKTRHLEETKIEVVNFWLDENEFLKDSTSPGSSDVNPSDKNLFTFMYLGNIGPVAGVEFLIKSFAKADLDNALLVIAGAGSRKSECVRIAESFKSSKIKFYDVPKGKVAEIQEQADVMMLPVKIGAAKSSLPSKLVSYMLSRKPIIASVEENSDTGNTIRKANCGWIVPPENIDLLANAMTDAIKTPKSELQTYGTNGFRFAMENFSKKINLKKLVNIINEAANR